MSKSSSSSTSASDSAPIPASQASASPHAVASEPPGGKRAVVLCGGGITGAMYELGALAAMDDYLDATSQPRPGTSGLSSTSFDIYVGISAGSFVATMLCAGISPRRLARAVQGDPADRYLVPHQRTDLFKFEPLRATRIGLTLSGVALRSLYRVLSGRISPGDIPSELLAATPGGVLSLKPYARFLRRLISRQGLPPRLSAMPKELFIPANDLDGGHRVIFGGQGSGELADVHIADAICASSAIPLVFEPVRIGDRDYVDGGTGKADHVDVALKRGAKLVLVINPMVPIAHDPAYSSLPGPAARLSQRGLLTVYDQTMRMSIKARLHQGLRRWAAEYPDATILLLEPDEADSEMFLQNPMNFDARVQILRYGYQSAVQQLRARSGMFDLMCRRHGLSGDIQRLKKVWP